MRHPIYGGFQIPTSVLEKLYEEVVKPTAGSKEMAELTSTLQAKKGGKAPTKAELYYFYRVKHVEEGYDLDSAWRETINVVQKGQTTPLVDIATQMLFERADGIKYPSVRLLRERVNKLPIPPYLATFIAPTSTGHGKTTFVAKPVTGSFKELIDLYFTIRALRWPMRIAHDATYNRVYTRNLKGNVNTAPYQKNYFKTCRIFVPGVLPIFAHKGKEGGYRIDLNPCESISQQEIELDSTGFNGVLYFKREDTFAFLEPAMAQIVYKFYSAFLGETRTIAMQSSKVEIVSRLHRDIAGSLTALGFKGIVEDALSFPFRESIQLFHIAAVGSILSTGYCVQSELETVKASKNTKEKEEAKGKFFIDVEHIRGLDISKGVFPNLTISLNVPGKSTRQNYSFGFDKIKTPDTIDLSRFSRLEGPWPTFY